MRNLKDDKVIIDSLIKRTRMFKRKLSDWLNYQLKTKTNFKACNLLRAFFVATCFKDR